MKKNVLYATIVLVATLTAALPAAADHRNTNMSTGYFGGGAAAFEQAVRNAGLVPSWSQPDGNRARAFLSDRARSFAGSTAATQAGRLLGLGRNAGWVGIGAQLLMPNVAE